MIAPYYADDAVTLHHGDCLDVLRSLPDASVDAVCTDPPYELGFMGRAWDASGIAYSVDLWREAWRLLKPGGHMLSFGGTRTWHRLVCAVEDAGFEIRDSIAWMYGSGFPKSHDVAKAIDKARDDRTDINRVTGWLAAQRDRAGLTNREIDAAFGFNGMAGHWTAAPHLKIAQVPKWEQWQKLRTLLGFGDEMDAEVWRLNGRKGTPGEAWGQREVVGPAAWDNSASHFRPGEDHTQRVQLDVTAPATDDARRWQGWGTALKPAFEPIVVARKPLIGTVAANVLAHGTGALNIDACRVEMSHADRERLTEWHGRYGGREYAESGVAFGKGFGAIQPPNPAGRWPTNVVLSHAPLLDEHGETIGDACADGCVPGCPVTELDAQGGGASRFFPTFRYEAKAPTAERPRAADGTAHPTVKPLDYMRWLVRLVTPPGGVVLEPFAGSGTTAEACVLEGFRCIAVEREAAYLPLITARLTKPLQPALDFGDAA